MPGRPIVFVDPHFRRMEEIFTPLDLDRLHQMVEVVWGKDDPMPSEDAARALSRAVAVVCTGWRYGDALSIADSLRAILDISGGFPRDLDYAQCFARGIRVLSAAPAFGPVVAEMALGMALAASRGIVAGDAAMRAGNEKWQRAGNVGTFSLFGKPVGLIGFGGIAQCLRRLIEPFACQIAAYDPWLGNGYLRSEGVEPSGLEELLTTSQVIFVLAAPTVENRALLSRELLGLIQSEAVLVLVSRAYVVDFDALTELVLAGRFKAAIDVFPIEPIPLDHPIRRASGAVLSPHRAGNVREGSWEIGRLIVDDLEAITRGLPPRRLLVAQPELITQYASIHISRPDNSKLC